MQHAAAVLGREDARAVDAVRPILVRTRDVQDGAVPRVGHGRVRRVGVARDDLSRVGHVDLVNHLAERVRLGTFLVGDLFEEVLDRRRGRVGRHELLALDVLGGGGGQLGREVGQDKDRSRGSVGDKGRELRVWEMGGSEPAGRYGAAQLLAWPRPLTELSTSVLSVDVRSVRRQCMRASEADLLVRAAARERLGDLGDGRDREAVRDVRYHPDVVRVRWHRRLRAVERRGSGGQEGEVGRMEAGCGENVEGVKVAQLAFRPGIRADSNLSADCSLGSIPRGHGVECGQVGQSAWAGEGGQRGVSAV